MFKLESYITPWLLSYIDQYVKLRPEDFQLSLWGGDVVFNNLELRLENIQKLVPTLPIIFQSGLIHELRIHIPWIRINSEPIVVTLNQIELVIVLNKQRLPINESLSNSPNDNPRNSVLIQQQQPTTPEQSNYVQSVLARIVNNVQIVVNNLIVKFVEDDVIISLSCRTAQCFAANQQWLKSFVELTAQDLSLRRLITLPDITLCLDRSDPTGRVRRYEVPLLSRCSFECRIQMFYNKVYQQLSTRPIQTRLSFICANIEISIVDNQLSMIRRLMERIMSLVKASSNMNTSDDSSRQESNASLEIKDCLANVTSLSSSSSSSIDENKSTVESGEKPNGDQQGWVSWAWSYVPSVSTLFLEEDEPDEQEKQNQPIETNSEQISNLANESSSSLESLTTNQTAMPLFLAGIEIDRIGIQYKVTKSNDEKQNLVPFIQFVVEEINITIERYDVRSSTSFLGPSTISQYGKVKVSTSKINLIWEERLHCCLSRTNLVVNQDEENGRTMILNFSINDLNVRDKSDLVVLPFDGTLNVEKFEDFSLIKIDLSSLKIRVERRFLIYLKTVLTQISSLISVVQTIFDIEESSFEDRIFVDDLRNGSMKKEISFCQLDDRTGSICWRYDKRRTICQCQINPFDLGSEQSVGFLEFFDVSSKNFVTWKKLVLSRREATFLDFSSTCDKNPYSSVWRLVFRCSSKSEIFSSFVDEIRIDSFRRESSCPSIELSICFSAFRFDFLFDEIRCDVFSLNLAQNSILFRRHFDEISLRFETFVELEICETIFFKKICLVAPSAVSLEFFLSKRENFRLVVDRLELRLGASAERFLQLFSAEKLSDNFFFSLRNATNEKISFKQKFSNENFRQVGAGQTFPFFFSRSDVANFRLEFLVDQQFSAPVDPNEIHENFQQIVFGKNDEKNFFLRRAPTRRIEIFSRFFVKNLTQRKVRLRFFFRRENASPIEIGDGSTTFDGKLDDFAALQIDDGQIISTEQIRQDNIFLRHENFSFYLQYFHDETFEAVVLTPIFLLQSFLPQSVELIFDENQTFPVSGNGATEIFSPNQQQFTFKLKQIDAERTSDVLFQFQPDSTEIFPSKLQIDDLYEFLTNFEFPSTGELKKKPSEFPSDFDSSPETTNNDSAKNSIDIRIEPFRLESRLKTILLQFKPLTLIENKTPFLFHFNGNENVFIDSFGSISVSNIEKSNFQFVLVDPADGKFLFSQTIELILRPVVVLNANKLIENQLYFNKFVDLLFVKSTNDEFYLVRLEHKFFDQIHVLTLREKYLIVNRTETPFNVTVFPVSKQSQVVDSSFFFFQLDGRQSKAIFRFQSVPSSEIFFYLHFQRVKNERSQNFLFSKPIALFSKLDEHFYRQNFNIFHRDSILKSEQNKNKFVLNENLHQSFRSQLFTVDQFLEDSTNRIIVSVEFHSNAPLLQIVNASENCFLSRAENFSILPDFIPPFSTVFIGIDSSQTATNVEIFTNGTRFFMGNFQLQDSLPSSIGHFFRNATDPKFAWSRPMKIDANLTDVFLPIPGLHDILIRSPTNSNELCRTLIIEPVHRQNFKSFSQISSSTGNSQSNIISETTPRQYRSNFNKSHSSLTQQYLKGYEQRYKNCKQRHVQFNILLKQFSLSLMDESTDIAFFTEIARLTMDNVELVLDQQRIYAEPEIVETKLLFSVDSLQIDNQAYNTKNPFEFPVVFISKGQHSSKQVSDAQGTIANENMSVNLSSNDDSSIPNGSILYEEQTFRTDTQSTDGKEFLLVRFHQINGRFLRFDVKIKEFEVFLEDQYIYFLLKRISEILPSKLIFPSSKEKEKCDELDNLPSRTPFVCDSLKIDSINMTVTVRASIKVYIGCQQISISVDKFEKKSIHSTGQQFLPVLTRHYVFSLLSRSPLLLGSFDLIGNPSILIRNFTDGIYDLFHLPYVGLRRGPTGFMIGISQGATSLLKHLSFGTLTSVTSFANSLARNMDRLSMDSEHTNRNEETYRHIPNGMTRGFLQGLELFGLSLLGAIAGLAEQPLSSLRNRDQSQAATSTVLTGFGKGLVGIVAKPVGGVAQLISQTGQGILYGTGLMNVPNRRCRPIEEDFRTNTTCTFLKLQHACQLMIDEDEIIDTLDYVIDHQPIEHGMFIVTKKGHFLIYHKDDENPHCQYLLNHVELVPSNESDSVILFHNLAFYVDSRFRQQFLSLCRFLRQ